MATITSLAGGDGITTGDSMTKINANFDNLNDDKIETSVLDTDTSLAANSDAKIATQKAVKAYVDGGGQQNASETVRGLVEEATDAEVTAGTATGGTGAKLFVTPAKLDTRIGNLSVVKKIEVDATEVTHTGTTETTLFDTTIPGGTLSTNNAIRIKAYVSAYNESNTPHVITLALKYGGTTVATITASDADLLFDGKGWIEGYVLADGAADVQKGTLSFIIFKDGKEISGDTVVGFDKLSYVAGGTGAVDSTSNQTLLISSDFSGADAGSNITVQWWIVEVIK